MKYILVLDGTQFLTANNHNQEFLETAKIFDTIRDAKLARSEMDLPYEIWEIKFVLGEKLGV